MNPASRHRARTDVASTRHQRGIAAPDARASPRVSDPKPSEGPRAIVVLFDPTRCRRQWAPTQCPDTGPHDVVNIGHSSRHEAARISRSQISDTDSKWLTAQWFRMRTVAAGTRRVAVEVDISTPVMSAHWPTEATGASIPVRCSKESPTAQAWREIPGLIASNPCSGEPGSPPPND